CRPWLRRRCVRGAGGAGESSAAAALREAEEDLGVSGLPRPAFRFSFLYDDGGARSWWSAVYGVRCELPVRPQAEEVAWYAFLPVPELRRRLGEWEWVPDGLAAWQRLEAHRPAG